MNVFLFLIFIQLPTFAQTSNADTLLVSREKIKWEALKTKSFGAHRDWFSKDMISIGYLPNANVYRTGFNDPIVFPKMDDFPAADFTLTGFKIVDATDKVKIISYQADGPINLYVTSVWARQGKEWKTICYQATKYK